MQALNDILLHSNQLTQKKSLKVVQNEDKKMKLTSLKKISRLNSIPLENQTRLDIEVEYDGENWDLSTVEEKFYLCI